METKIVLLVILLVIGALQGITYGIILWRTNTIHKIANRFLATILFFFSYRLLAETLYFFGLGRYDTWYYFLLEFNWIYGTLIYFFALSYINPNFRLRRKDWIHFLPVIIEVIWSFFIKAQNFYWDGTRESLTWLGYWGYVIWMHFPTMYVIGGALIVFYGSKAIRVLKNPPEIPGYRLIEKNIVWIRRVVWALVIFSVLFTLFTIIHYFFFDYAFNFFGYPIFVTMAVITYWLGIEGFSRRNTIAFKTIEVPSEKEMEQLRGIAEKINQKMQEERLFKNQELTVGLLSEAIETKSYLVTKTFTVVFKKKFTDYVNELRFEELKFLLSKPENEKFTLLSLAFEAGFNSKASFNRTVTRLTGKSPKHLKNS
ncbi:AraC family transcriptional regulator [Aureisphaera galaxeae]|uniref:helix-turn-helix domain-containing protein n=1 Tax=Aureisphaera galaxeae TaxID=1538023 RepID=UPI0023503C99|nr:AraC family transcriptional regulator [Aureisphaera galaxeae]MDC8002973.1 AraC family transcriptional regulator [Aureisphaera galaxeae]